MTHKPTDRKILKQFLSKRKPHPAALGFRPKKSIADHAWAHAGAATLITADIEDFFQSAEGDRRVKALTITPAGVRLRSRVMELMSQPPEAIAALSESDQRALRDILARAVEHLRADD